MSAEHRPIEGRSAGRAPIAGRIRVGQIVSTGSHTKASIPSRFETILNTGEREKDAFGRRTHRFDDPENDLPGPGAYRKPRTLMKTTPSLSSKGTGGFASTSKISVDQPRPLFYTPGPGAYDTSSQTTPPRPSPAFALPVERRAVAVSSSSTGVLPGPGEYATDHGTIQEKATQIKSGNYAFGSRCARAAEKLKDVPGPGEYHPHETSVRKSQSTHAVFKSTTKREGPSTAPSPPPIDTSVEGLVKALPKVPIPGPPPGHKPHGGQVKPTIASLMGTDVPVAKTSPAADEILQRKHQVKPSSMFASTTLDRFGKPVVRFVPEEVENPGPGQYSTEKPAKRLLVSSSWALSASERFGPPVKEHFKPPGPAFYNPPIQPERVKQSFHLNNKGLWV
eukprot:Sspe_Gene.2470::Locus_819_Transcript_12_13_Confidence_0.037_Length_2299::g.2470::m.2470